MQLRQKHFTVKLFRLTGRLALSDRSRNCLYFRPAAE